MCPTDEVKEEEVSEDLEEVVTEADVQAALVEGQPSKVEDLLVEEVESKVTEKEYDRLTDKEKEKYGI